MKKLIYLFLTLLIVACSDDSSDGNQLFLEKYDSVVWEQLPLDNESYRIAFINSSNSLTEYSFLIWGGYGRNVCYYTS